MNEPVAVTDTDASRHDIDHSQFVRRSTLGDDTSVSIEDSSPRGLVEKRRRELCCWLEALLWRYPNLLKVSS